jgi:negative regulator of flagellin synthesis FlgM
MKVPNTNETTATLVDSYRTSENIKKETKAGGTFSKSENVELSNNVKDYSQIKKVLENVPDVREDKVQQLKKQINEGTYNVSGEKIAEKMVSEALLDIIA